MTNEEIMAMDLEGVEARAAAIADEAKADGADIEALTAEAEALKERRAALIEEQRKAAEAVAKGAGVTVTKVEESKKTMTIDEVRATKEYLNAYAEYIKNGDDTECRSILSGNATGLSGTSGVPMPTYVEERIRTAWENDEILSRVRRTEVKGNLKVGFELSATGAAVHAEGAAAPTEQVLNLGTVTLVPETLKKWVSISDEVLDAHGREFLDYIFDEIEYRIIKLAADKVVADIVNSSTTASTTAPAVVKIATAGIADFIKAFAELSDEATNPVIIMHKQSYAYYKGLAMAANYAVDPFDGMTVLFNNTLAPASAASGNIAIVGDLDGVHCNFPAGYQPTFKNDELSLAEKDLVKIVGRLPMAHGVTASGRFCVITKS